jgi:hypothetical protein
MDDNRMRGLVTIFIGLGLVGLGIFFLISQVFHLDVWSFLWPFFIIVPGLFFFIGMFVMGKNGSPLAVPGSVVTMVGLILLYQNITGHWASWAYAWALIFPTAVGVGIAIAGQWSDEPRTVRSGALMACIGLVVFMFFGIFFELLLNISGLRSGMFGRFLFPMMIIGAGLVVVVWALLQRGRDGSEPDDTGEASDLI